MKFIYRNNEVGFKIWAAVYIEAAERIVTQFPFYKRFRESFYQEKQQEYKEALKVLNEYKSFMLLLDEEEKSVFERTIMRNEIINDINGTRVFLIKPILFQKWEMVCFKNKKTRIKKIDNKALGSELRRLREINYLSVTAVANALGIDPSTLRNYELGNRTISTNALYGLAQIYNVGIDKIIGR